LAPVTVGERRHDRRMHESTFVLRPISPTDADLLRAGGGPRYVADAYPGYPCRQCLRDAEVGDELVLVSHDPFTGRSEYRSASPIFLHASPCTPPDLDTDSSRSLPEQLTRRQLSVRSFDIDEMMIDAAVIDGSDLEATIDRFFETAESHSIHVHNATRGCWAVSVDRSPTNPAVVAEVAAHV
jgi:hypothetical protein